MDDYNASDVGFYQPEVDDAVIQEENEERAMTHQAAWMIDAILERFDEEIDQATRIEGIDPESKISIEAQLLAKQELARILTDVRSRIETLKTDHLPD